MTYAEWIQAAQIPFPGLTERNSRPTSPADDGYNCIAWAADDTERWWWPDPQEQKYWPPTVPRVETIEAFALAFGQLGYSEPMDASVEPGKQKIAIFANDLGKPTHVARQLSNGWWASKLGQQIDIEHELSAVQGPAYGAVAVVLGRAAATPTGT